MGKPINILFSLNSKSVSYLLVGVWNTIFAYVIGVSIYTLLSGQLHTVFIGTICNVICISMSFMTYKLFVFKTSGNWVLEYGRSYIVYGATAILGTALLWLMVDYFNFNIWYVQAFIILITVFISFLGHNFFTFRSRKS